MLALFCFFDWTRCFPTWLCLKRTSSDFLVLSETEHKHSFFLKFHSDKACLDQNDRKCRGRELWQQCLQTTGTNWVYFAKGNALCGSFTMAKHPGDKRAVSLARLWQVYLIYLQRSPNKNAVHIHQKSFNWRPQETISVLAIVMVIATASEASLPTWETSRINLLLSALRFFTGSTWNAPSWCYNVRQWLSQWGPDHINREVFLQTCCRALVVLLLLLGAGGTCWRSAPCSLDKFTRCSNSHNQDPIHLTSLNYLNFDI